MIAIIDYGLGNVRAFYNIYRSLGISASIVRNVDELCEADRVILPGVGSFDWAIGKLKKSGMVDALNKLVLQDNVPVLGVCVGLQIMARSSAEGSSSGLCWLDADVVSLEKDELIPLPHMGWNEVKLKLRCPLFEGISDKSFYFLHSYYIRPKDTACISSVTKYKNDFPSSISRDNIYATQFHPEKSHQSGVQLLKNFAEYC